MRDLATIPGVELVRVGTHEISTGTWVVERADLADAVAAAQAGAVRAPVLKFGHDSPMGDGAPAWGRVVNLRTVEDGDLLVGDFIDVPRRLAEVMPHAWPSRSVECWCDHEAADGRTYRLVVTAVALLGAVMPGVVDLADVDAVADAYGIAASGRRVVLASTTAHEHPTPRQRAIRVAAARRRRIHRSTTGVTP